MCFVQEGAESAPLSQVEEGGLVWSGESKSRSSRYRWILRAGGTLIFIIVVLLEPIITFVSPLVNKNERRTLLAISLANDFLLLLDAASPPLGARRGSPNVPCRRCFTLELLHMHFGLFCFQVVAEATNIIVAAVVLQRLSREFCLDDALTRGNRIFFKAIAFFAVAGRAGYGPRPGARRGVTLVEDASIHRPRRSSTWS